MRTMNQAQLTKLGEPTITQLMADIQSGKAGQAVTSATQLHQEITYVHDFFIYWCAYFIAAIKKNHSAAEVDQLWKDTVKRAPINMTLTTGHSDEESCAQIATIVRNAIDTSLAPEKASALIPKDSLPGGLRDNTLHELIKAIEASHWDASLALADRLQTELMWVHDLLLLWSASFLSFIGEKQGDDAVAKVWEDGVYHLHAGHQSKESTATSDQDLLEMVALGTRGHGAAIGITEKEDYFDLSIEHCGSGGRLIRGGAYDGAESLYRMQGPSLATYKQRDFPSFCTHCYINSKTSLKNTSGQPRIQIIASDRPGYETCAARIYKQAT